jgi:hypothetical protein
MQEERDRWWLFSERIGDTIGFIEPTEADWERLREHNAEHDGPGFYPLKRRRRRLMTPRNEDHKP